MEPNKDTGGGGGGGLFADEDDELFRPALEDPLTSKMKKMEEVDLFDGSEDEMTLNDREEPEEELAQNAQPAESAMDNDESGQGEAASCKANSQFNGLSDSFVDHSLMSDVDMGSSSSPIDAKENSQVGDEAIGPSAQEVKSPADHHRIDIEIEKFERRGEGVGAYVAYMVVCKIPPSLTGFPKSQYVIWRRFSDFLGLHDTLCEKYLALGRIVPPAPAKNVIGMTKTKMSKSAMEDDQVTVAFLERRRASLERYLRRTASHPILSQDPTFCQFITLESELPKANQTAVLSSTTIKRIWDRVSDGINKYAASKIDDNDAWFNEKQYEVEQMEVELRKLLNKADSLISIRREYAIATDQFCKCLSVLTACEENTSLSRALSFLCETMEKISQLQSVQAEKDFFLLFETLKDYIALIEVAKDVFYERTKVWNNWQMALQTLAKKRENRRRHESAGKMERVPQALKEVEEWEQKSTEAEKQFANISVVIQKEYKRFEQQRVNEFKQMLISELESIANTQQQLAKLWEAFIPDAQAIL